MRKFYIVILLFAFISGCEKDFDEIIDVTASDFQVTGTNFYPSNTFRYVQGDSLITIYLSLSNSKNVASVFFNIYASDEIKLNDSPFPLLDNGNSTNGDERAGDNRFTNKFPLSRQNPVGTYKINYFVTDRGNATKLVAVQQFIYDNGQANVAPVISNLTMPDSIARGVSFIFTITTNDANGLNDIDVVYFELFRPDGTVVEESGGNTKFLLHDDGNFDVFGDETAGDGVYSFKNSFLETAQTGTWRFEFHAKDRGGLLSNIIEKSVVVE